MHLHGPFGEMKQISRSQVTYTQQYQELRLRYAIVTCTHKTNF